VAVRRLAERVATAGDAHFPQAFTGGPASAVPGWFNSGSPLVVAAGATC
jgi:hypothetical protein